jgi:hypothetical protein
VDVVALRAEVTQIREAIAAVEAARAAAMLSTEAFAQEATAAWDGVTLRIKDVEDRAALVLREAALVLREALERVSRVEAENSAALASARDDAESLV